MIKLIGCLDKRLQRQQISSSTYVAHVIKRYHPSAKCPNCGNQWMHCILKSTGKHKQVTDNDMGMTQKAIFPQYRFSCDSCGYQINMLLTTDLEISHSNIRMDHLFAIMYDKKIKHATKKDITNKYGISRNTYMKWCHLFEQDYILLKEFFPQSVSDKDILEGKIPLSHALMSFFLHHRRFFLHQEESIAMMVLYSEQTGTSFQALKYNDFIHITSSIFTFHPYNLGTPQ